MNSILIFVDWFEPGFKGGGPIRSIAGFIYNLKNNFTFNVVTSISDYNTTEAYNNIKANEWLFYDDNVEVLYLNKRLSFSMFNNILNYKDFNWVYLNSFFSYNFSILPYVFSRFSKTRKNNFLIAPRGEFNPERLAVKKIKKIIFLKIVKLLGFYKKNHWHATSNDEQNYINDIFPNQKTLLASNLTKLNVTISASKKMDLSLSIVYISRIVSYKNLDYAIKLVDSLDYQVKFDYYGPVEDLNYFNYCDKLAKNSKNFINYKGVLNHSEVNKTLNKYNVFLFPSSGENFGHVIAEAIMAGCVVITSDNTPWSKIQTNKVGWALPLKSKESFIKILNYLCELSEIDFKELQNKVFLNAKNLLNEKTTIKKYIKYLN